MIRKHHILTLAVLTVALSQLLPPLALASEMTFADALADLAGYDYGKDNTSLREIEHMLSSSAEPANMLRQLTDLLGSRTSAACKQFVCQQISIYGTAEDVPKLMPLLSEHSVVVTESAREALERIPGAAADKAMIEALGGAGTDETIGLLNALGARRSVLAVPTAAEHLIDPNDAVVQAAAMALAKISTRRAVKTLDAAAAEPAPLTRRAIFETARLAAANELMDRGKRNKASNVFASLLDSVEQSHVRVGAFLGLVRARGAKEISLVVDALSSKDPQLQAAAAQSVRELSGKGVTSALAAKLDDLEPENQILLVTALGYRRDPAALNAVIKMANSVNLDVRLAALSAMAQLGDASAVTPLANIATTGTPQERKAASQALARLSAPGVDEAIVAVMEQAEHDKKIELIRCLGLRHATSAKSALIKVAGSGAPDIRAAAFDSLAALTTAEDIIPLTYLLAQLHGDTGRKQAEAAVLSAAKKREDGGRSLDIIAAGISAGASPDTQCSMLRILAQLGDAEALDAVRLALQHGTPAVKDEAVRALTHWPDGVVLGDLMTLARSSDNETHRILALRAAIKILNQESDRTNPAYNATRTPETALALYKNVMSLATRPEEQRLVLSGIGNVRIDETRAYLNTLLKNPALRAEAKLALEKLSTWPLTFYPTLNPSDASYAVDRDPKTCWNSGIPQRAEQQVFIDLGWPDTFNTVVLDGRSAPDCYPRGYVIKVGMDPFELSEPMAQGKGQPRMVVTFAPVKARYICIQLTASSENTWVIDEVQVENR